MQASPRLVQVERRAEEVRTPGERWPDVRRIVVVRNDRLGDLVLTLPAVDALRSSYPGAWLALLVRPATAALARLVEGVDEVLEDTGDADRLGATLREFRADLLVSISPGGRIPWVAMMARVPHRVGQGYRVYSPLFERRVDEHRHAGARHEVEYALSYAHRAGAGGRPARFPIVVPQTARDCVAGWLETHRISPPYVLLHPGSGGSCPAWPTGHFVRLATLLRAEGVTVVLSLGPTDESAAKVLDAAEPEVRRLPRFGGDLQALAACVAGASLVISNSTGPLHLAAALKTPTLAFHAPWPSCAPGRWGPYAADGWCLVADLPGAERWSRRERVRGGADLLATISPAAALSCALALLDRQAPALR